MAAVVAVNDEAVFHDNLAQSAAVRSGRLPVILERGYASAGEAYNDGIRQSDRQYLVFVHQDVYLPSGWDARLMGAIERLEVAHAPWAVLGVWGVRANREFCGRVWCNGGNREHHGNIEGGLCEVESIDEIVIVLKRSSGLSFDEKLPGFHLYATDVIKQANQKGLKAFVFDGPVIHNSRANPNPFDRAFFRAYTYMRHKWRSYLPLQTCTVPIVRNSWPLYKAWFRRELRWRQQTRSTARHPAPEDLALRLGY